jgi:hypothetical protein
MTLKFIKPAAAAAALAMAGAALISTAAPAAAANPPYSGCDGWRLCLYENGGGAGSKEILIAPPAGTSQIVHLKGHHFVNGDEVDNNVSSWINNSQCSVEFWDDPNGELHPSLIDTASQWQWGATHDYAFGTPLSYLNDRISSLRITCP